MNAAQGALILDRLLTDPRYAPILRTLAEMMPTQLRDQAGAAERDTASMMGFLAEALGSKTGETMHAAADVPDWLRMDLLSRVAAFGAGTADTCMHSPSPDLPQMVFAAACKPNLVVCGPCANLLSFPSGSIPGRTCDACGHVCAGPEADDGIYPGLTRLGHIVFSYGVCRDCRPQCPPAEP